MPFNKDIAAAPWRPVAGDPARIGSRRGCPVAGRPYITSAIPTVIATNPHITSMRTRSIVLNDGCGRGHADYYLGLRRVQRKS